MDQTIINRKMFEQAAIDQRSKRIHQEQHDHVADYFKEFGFDYDRLDTQKLVARASNHAKIDQILHMKECYVNTSKEPYHMTCDTQGIVVSLDLIKHQFTVGDNITIPVGAVIFIGYIKRIDGKYNKPTNVKCDINIINLPRIDVECDTTNPTLCVVSNMKTYIS